MYFDLSHFDPIKKLVCEWLAGNLLGGETSHRKKGIVFEMS